MYLPVIFTTSERKTPSKSLLRLKGLIRRNMFPCYSLHELTRYFPLHTFRDAYNFHFKYNIVPIINIMLSSTHRNKERRKNKGNCTNTKRENYYPAY